MTATTLRLKSVKITYLLFEVISATVKHRVACVPLVVHVSVPIPKRMPLGRVDGTTDDQNLNLCNQPISQSGTVIHPVVRNRVLDPY
jgi:hypothetical protein